MPRINSPKRSMAMVGTKSTEGLSVFDATREQFQRVRAMVDSFTPQELERPTPCAGWLVRDLMAHQVGTGAWLFDNYVEPFLAGRPTVHYDLAQQSTINAAAVA